MAIGQSPPQVASLGRAAHAPLLKKTMRRSVVNRSDTDGATDTPGLQQVAPVMGRDDVETRCEAETNSAHERIRKSDAGQVKIGIRRREGTDVRL
jgi:hypothetical protein